VTNKTIKHRHQFDGKHQRVHAPIGGKSLTKQAHAAECDINRIVAQHAQTGVITHVKDSQGAYGDFTMGDYTESMTKIAEANQLFMELPSGIRSQFQNEPARFLDFATNPENEQKMFEMGLINAPHPEDNALQTGSNSPKEEVVPDKALAASEPLPS